MSAVIDLLIPHGTDVRATGLRSRDQSWQGIRSEESESNFDWGPDLTVRVHRWDVPAHMQALLPPVFQTTGWDFLGVSGERLDDCWREKPEDDEVRTRESGLESLLRALLDERQPWAFFFMADDQYGYDEVVRGNLGELNSRMRENLAANRRPIGLVVVNLPESGSVPPAIAPQRHKKA